MQPSTTRRRMFALRPRHGALGAFVLTLLAYTPTMTYFEDAPQYGPLGDTFLFAFLCATLASAVLQLGRALRGAQSGGFRGGMVLAVAVYIGSLVLFVGALFAPSPWPVAAVAAGVGAGAALPWLAVAWARAVAVPFDRALILCAVVAGASSVAGWALTLLPVHALAVVFCLLLLGGTLPLLRLAVPEEGIEAEGGPSDKLGRLASVTWLPLLGVAVYVFMANVMTHSAFGVVRASFVGGVAAALLLLVATLCWAKRPLLPWAYRVLVPALGAAFIVLGSFPPDTVPKEASVVALYGFYIMLALLGCALVLAVAHGCELPSNVVCGFALAVVTASALLGQTLSSALMATHDFAPWITVLTGAFMAVLLVFLGRTAWDELVTPCDGDGALDLVERAPEPSVRDTLEARCARVAAASALSPREAEVLVYLARGFAPAYIAKELVLSISTVRTHVRNIYRKLNVNKREELLHLIDED